MSIRSGRCWRTCAAGLISTFAAATILVAQAPGESAAARAEFDRAKKAAGEKQADVALAGYRRAMDLDPSFFDAHSEFVSLTRQQFGYEKRNEANASLRVTYGEMLKAHAKVAAIHYFLGDTEDNVAKADEHYLRAVALDPKLARAFQQLAFHAEMRGDDEGSRAYLKRATEAAPDDPAYAFYYAFSFDPGDRTEWIRLSLDVVKRFPTSERAPQALYWLGVRAPTDTERIRYLERLKAQFPPSRFTWSASGMETLFDTYARTRPYKAIELAREMLGTTWGDKVAAWKGRLAVQEAIANAQAFVSAGRAADALPALEAVQPPKNVSLTQFHLAKAAAERATGQTGKAYERLAALVAVEPVPDLHTALLEYGKMLGRGSDQLAADLAARREKPATPAEDFEFENYLDRSKGRLSSYKGKVVLLNFWYPG